MIEGIGVTNVAVSHALATSPALVKLDAAIYGVRGLSIPAKALSNARTRRAAERMRNGPGPPQPLDNDADADDAASLRAWVTQSASTVSVRRRVVYLPAFLAAKLVGTFEHTENALPPIRVGSRQQIRGLAAAAESIGIRAGERFQIEFDDAKRTYRILVSQAERPLEVRL